MEAFATRSHPSGSAAIGGVVRRYRIKGGHSQRALAAVAGVHYSTIQKIETGDRGMGIDTLALLGEVLGPKFENAVCAQVREEMRDGAG
jgi:transcriptional regulator with XRE-family HTH domain